MISEIVRGRPCLLAIFKGSFRFIRRWGHVDVTSNGDVGVGGNEKCACVANNEGSTRISEKAKATPPPESEPPKKRGKRSSASKNEASQEEEEDTKEVQMQEADNTKDDKDIEEEKNIVKENQDDKSVEDTDVNKSTHSGEAKAEENVKVPTDEEKSNAADEELHALKDKVDEKGPEGSDIALIKDEEKVGQPQEETKEFHGSGEPQKFETCTTANKMVEVDGVNKEELHKSTHESEGEIKEIEGTKVNSEEHHKHDEISEKAEAELTENGNHGRTVGRLSAVLFFILCCWIRRLLCSVQARSRTTTLCVDLAQTVDLQPVIASFVRVLVGSLSLSLSLSSLFGPLSLSPSISRSPLSRWLSLSLPLSVDLFFSLSVRPPSLTLSPLFLSAV
ncbi:hypothetical protein RJT34_04131 [Clitoria ternatea]|uniref:Uncharacterized protein n=1 Tax=Clitoria ternatea TaxID=43366 RepID=A0AAN9KKP9_CLITE